MLLVIIGNIGSGKSTAANILKEIGFIEYSFATPLKEFALSIGFNYEDVYGTQEEKTRINSNFGISGRQFMQRFGTDVMRKETKFLFDNHIDNIWTKAMEIKIKNALALGKNVVVSDGRFPDEAKLIKDLGGIIIRIKRQNNKFACSHASETEMNNIVADVEYCNDGTIEDLRSFLMQIKECLESHSQNERE